MSLPANKMILRSAENNPIGTSTVPRCLFKMIVAVALVYPVTTSGQTKVTPKDSVAIKNQIEGFYSWYIDVINNRRSDEGFRPIFVRQADGMTALDFTKYRDNLRKYKFTEAFIQRKINEYSQCVDNLKKIPFEKFSQLTELDDFESINCDFGNKYEWTGGQEPKEKAELISLKVVDKKTISGQVIFGSRGLPDGGAIVTFRKIKKEWRVDDIFDCGHCVR